MPDSFRNGYLCQKFKSPHAKLNFLDNPLHFSPMIYFSLFLPKLIVKLTLLLQKIGILQPVLQVARFPENISFHTFFSFLEVVQQKVGQTYQLINFATQSCSIFVQLENHDGTLVLFVIHEEKTHVEEDGRYFLDGKLFEKIEELHSLAFVQLFINQAYNGQQHVSKSGRVVFFAEFIAKLSVRPQELFQHAHLYTFTHQSFVVYAELKNSWVYIFALTQKFDGLFGLAAAACNMLEIGFGGDESFRADDPPVAISIFIQPLQCFNHLTKTAQVIPNPRQPQHRIHVVPVALQYLLIDIFGRIPVSFPLHADPIVKPNYQFQPLDPDLLFLTAILHVLKHC